MAQTKAEGRLGLGGGRSPVTRRIGERGSSWSGRVRAQSAQRASDPSGRRRLALVRLACPHPSLPLEPTRSIRRDRDDKRDQNINFCDSTERASKLSAGPAQRSDEFNIEEIQKSLCLRYKRALWELEREARPHQRTKVWAVGRFSDRDRDP